MATLAKKPAPQAETVAATAPARFVVGNGSPAGVSIVGEMQASLEHRLNQTPGKWSSRRTLVFILATCGSFWALVLSAVFR